MGTKASRCGKAVRFSLWLGAACVVLLCGLLWYYLHTIESLARDDAIEAEAFAGCAALSVALERFHRKGQLKGDDVTLEEALSQDASLELMLKDRRFYRLSDFSVRRMKFAESGAFVGVIVVRGGVAGDLPLPSWVIDFGMNPHVFGGPDCGISKLGPRE